MHARSACRCLLLQGAAHTVNRTAHRLEIAVNRGKDGLGPSACVLLYRAGHALCAARGRGGAAPQELRSKSAMLAAQLSAQLASQVSGGVAAVLLAARQEQQQQEAARTEAIRGGKNAVRTDTAAMQAMGVLQGEVALGLAQELQSCGHAADGAATAGADGGGGGKGS